MLFDSGRARSKKASKIQKQPLFYSGTSVSYGGDIRRLKGLDGNTVTLLVYGSESSRQNVEKGSTLILSSAR